MIILNGREYKELRCYKCQKFIVYHNIKEGRAFFQCPRCGFINEWNFTSLKSVGNKDRMSKELAVINSNSDTPEEVKI